jgi:hypothetical protein
MVGALHKSPTLRIEVGSRSVVNIDHHSPCQRFYRTVSSGNLAAHYVRDHGCLDESMPVLINHTDCDSVITAAILRGLLPPEPIFENAVIAADHTGATDPIADLLQALDPLRDFDISLRNLRLLLSGQPLDEAAGGLVEKRHAGRCRALEMVAQGRFDQIGKVAVAKFASHEKVPGEFVPQALPASWVILVASPMQNGRWETKIRLRLAAPAGLTLFDVGMTQLEPRFGGKWNAGSTKRSGGSNQDPMILGRAIAEVLDRYPSV